MKKRKLGQQGLEVSQLGLGCMGLTWGYGPTNEAESIEVLKRAYELGVNFWDTAEIYGPYNNEELIGRVIKGLPREKLTIATKFGFEIDPKGGLERGVNSKPEHVKKALEGSLKRLGTDYVDLYYQHRLDPNTPIEDTMGALAELVNEGKIRYIGLSEVGSQTIRRAHAVHPLTAVQTEYSIWERHVEESVLPTLRELGVGFVAYSPLGRGLLAGKINTNNDIDKTDFRRDYLPRFQDENIKHNLILVNQLKEIASQHKVTPAQVALAWLLRQGEDIVPIPGTKHVKYLEENVKAVTIEIPESTWDELQNGIQSFKPAGNRYYDQGMDLIDSK